MAHVLPDGIRSSYAEYKLRESELLHYFQRLAINCGHQFNGNNAPCRTNANNDDTHSTTNQTAAHSTPNVSDGDQPLLEARSGTNSQLYIRIHQLANMLQSIVHSKQVVNIEIGMADRLRDVIAKRRCCAAFYRRLYRSLDEDHDLRRRIEQHDYVIMCPEGYIDILKPIWPMAVPMSFHDVPKWDEHNDFINFFDCLQIQDETEPKENPVETESKAIATTESKSKPETEIKTRPSHLDLEEEELDYAQLHLLMDLRNLENILEQIFIGVIAGSGTINVAVSTLDLAIRIARNMNADTNCRKPGRAGVLSWPRSFFETLQRDEEAIILNSSLRSYEIICNVLQLSTQNPKRSKDLFDNEEVKEMYASYSELTPEQQQWLETKHFTRLVGAAKRRPSAVLPYHNSQLVSTIKDAISKKDTILSPSNVGTFLTFAVRTDFLLSVICRSFLFTVREDLLEGNSTVALENIHNIQILTSRTALSGNFEQINHQNVLESAMESRGTTPACWEVLVKPPGSGPEHYIRIGGSPMIPYLEVSLSQGYMQLQKTKLMSAVASSSALCCSQLFTLLGHL